MSAVAPVSFMDATMDKRKTTLLIIVAVTTAVIFAHSALPAASSWAESGAIGSVFAPVLGRLHAGALGLLAGLGVDASGTLTYGVFVRKVAHLVEYGLLGAEGAVAMVLLTGMVRSPYLWTCLFAVLSVAVVDEFIQLLSGRTSSVADVLLDFCGGCFGIAIALGVAAVVLAVSARIGPSRNSGGANRAE